MPYVGLLGCGAGLIIGAGMGGVGASSTAFQVAHGKHHRPVRPRRPLIGASTFVVRSFFNLGTGVS